jgi:hypothetical protein
MKETKAIAGNGPEAKSRTKMPLPKKLSTKIENEARREFSDGENPALSIDRTNAPRRTYPSRPQIPAAMGRAPSIGASSILRFTRDRKAGREANFLGCGTERIAFGRGAAIELAHVSPSSEALFSQCQPPFPRNP